LKEAADFPITFELAERAFSIRLDRRRNYAIINGVLCEEGRWSDSCSGCTASYEELGYVADRGNGCHECGHTGRRRTYMYVPRLITEQEP
jgi:hypothetical protein